jgi:hypothetical protein
MYPTLPVRLDSELSLGTNAKAAILRPTVPLRALLPRPTARAELVSSRRTRLDELDSEDTTGRLDKRDRVHGPAAGW